LGDPLRLAESLEAKPSPCAELRRFARFCELIGIRLEPFQVEIIREVLSGRREVVALLPRGCGKTTLMAAYGLYTLLAESRSSIVIAAATREQAGHLYGQSRKFVLASPKLRKVLKPTRREIRTPLEGRMLVISADAEKQLGWDPDLIFIDELGSHRSDDLHSALRSSLVKKPHSRLVVISTAGAREADTPLGELRKRALRLAEVSTDGALTRATGEHLALLEWRVPDDADIDDPEVVKEAIPASWIGTEAIAEQREALREPVFQRLIANQWVSAEEAFIGAAEWDACAAAPEISDGAEVVVGVDASIRHDATAVVIVRRAGDVYHALWRVWEPSKGREISLGEVEAHVRELTRRYAVAKVVYDPHYAWHMAQRLEDEGAPMVEWSHKRMAGATRTLHEIVSHGRLRHGGADVPRRHALAAEVVERDYGLILSKRATREPIDCVVALAMAVEIAAAAKPKRRSAYEDHDLVVA
jgi:phage terminase large subunit-like protein